MIFAANVCGPLWHHTKTWPKPRPTCDSQLDIESISRVVQWYSMMFFNDKKTHVLYFSFFLDPYDIAFYHQKQLNFFGSTQLFAEKSSNIQGPLQKPTWSGMKIGNETRHLNIVLLLSRLLPPNGHSVSRLTRTSVGF